MHPFDAISEFKNFMLEHGIETSGDLIADGETHRGHITGHKSGTKNLRYKIHRDGIRPAGYFEDFKTGLLVKWKASIEARPITPEQKQQMLDTHRQREEQAEQKQLQAAAKAQHLINISKPALNNDHPYLKQKNVKAHGLYLLKNYQRRYKNETSGQWEQLSIPNVLLVPLIDMQGQLWNVQLIYPQKIKQLNDRNKDFPYQSKTDGVFHVIGAPGDELIICEGYATGATLYEETGIQVLCAMSAGNLLPVAKAARAADPQKQIIICADNDTKTPGNPGVTKAKQAAYAVNAKIAIPPCPGDFNDFNNMGF